MCVPLEEWADAGASDAWIGRDVDRFPGGDHNKFQTSCKACHSVMDGFRIAFAKWNYNNGPNHSAVRPGDGSFDASGIADKVLKNRQVFPGGYVIRNDSFVNNAVGASNLALFGWREFSGGGSGVNGLGKAIAHSKRFSQCMVKRVYDSVCRTNLNLKSEMKFVQPLADRFEQRNYNLRELFEQVAIQPSCMGAK